MKYRVTVFASSYDGCEFDTDDLQHAQNGVHLRGYRLTCNEGFQEVVNEGLFFPYSNVQQITEELPEPPEVHP